MNGKTWFSLLLVFLVFSWTIAFSENASWEPLDYSDAQLWIYQGTTETDPLVDVFFLAPSAFGGKEGSYLLDLSFEKGIANFTGVINMEKGIYDEEARFFAPIYRQVGYNVYDLPEEEAETYKLLAYQDVRDAFQYYMEHENEGRPFLLAGFSQGAEMAIRLMKDLFGDEKLQSQLIACYAIGWRLTEDDVTSFPQLKPAEAEDDVGVIVSFNSEAEDIRTSLSIPEGVWSYGINPLNWKTDATLADKSLNLGACFTDYSGAIVEEIPELTGAYLDEERGALKVTDIDMDVYHATIGSMQPGVYHLYDYQFFYRNLQQNVRVRIQTYLDRLEE